MVVRIASKKSGPSPTNPGIVEPFGSLRKLEERLSKDHHRRRPVLLSGPTGCGKTTLVEAFAGRLGRPLEMVVGSAEMLPSELIGRWHLGAQGSHWRDNALTRAVVEGRPFYFDEIATVGEDVLRVLYPLLDHRRVLVLNDRDGSRIPAHPDFWFVASYNPPARLPAPLRQRCRIIPVDYLPPDEEAAFLIERSGVTLADAAFLVAAAGVTRDPLKGRMAEGASTRLLLAMAEDLMDSAGRDEVVESMLLALTDDEPTRQSLRQALRSAGLLSLDEVRGLRRPADSPVDRPGDDDFFETENESMTDASSGEEE